MPDLIIRDVAESDAPKVVELLNAIIEAGGLTVMDTPFSIEEQVGFIRSLPERAIYKLALESSGRIVGIQDILPHSSERALAHVGDVSTFVALDSRGRGIGRRLCGMTFEEARRVGFRKLRANVRADNSSAIGFYSRRGFESIGTAKKHALVNGHFVDEVLLERFLDEEAGRGGC